LTASGWGKTERHAAKLEREELAAAPSPDSTGLFWPGQGNDTSRLKSLHTGVIAGSQHHWAGGTAGGC